MDGLGYVESSDFASTVNLAGNLRKFIDILAGDEVVQGLRAEDVYVRALELSAKSVPEGCENPFDVAVACYLYVLRNQGDDFSWAARFLLADRRNNWFWAKKVARHYLGV